MIRPRSATFTLVLLALASGCSGKSSAPGPAHGAADAKSMPLEQGVAPAPERAAAEPTNASPALPRAETERDAPSGASAADKDDALAGSRVQIAEPMINGGLDRDIIRRKAMDHEADLRACHARAPELAGTVAVKLSVDARGLVKDVELGEHSELDDRELVDCILEAVAGWSFAGEATAAATVELGIELTPAN